MKGQIIDQNMEGTIAGANPVTLEEAPQGTFKKDLSKMNIWALALGAIIGWGCFVMPGVNFLPKAGPSAMLGMLIGGMVMARKEGLRLQTVISAIGTVLAAFFIILSFVPGSPGFLSVPSMIILLVWIALGIIFFIRIKDNFLHGKWEGVSVEKILLSKMKAETNQ